MRDYDPATLTYLAARPHAIRARLLIWIAARDRISDARATLGLWNGDDSQAISIDGITRTYQAGGALIDIEPVMAGVGVQVRMQQIRLSPVSAAVILAIEGYDARLAPVEIHRALFDVESGQLVAEPHRIFKGWVDEIDAPRPAVGQEGTVTLTLASSARALTRTLATKYSDTSMRQRGGDRGFRYADVSGSVPIYWGEKKAAAPKAAPGAKAASWWQS